MAFTQTLKPAFFQRDALLVAPELLGKLLVRSYEDGTISRFRITEVEVYRGEEDLACHASKGRTKRTEVMYHNGGKIYVYLIYGIYWMLNLVTNTESFPAAILIRGVKGINGPGKLGKALLLDQSFYGKIIQKRSSLWLEDDGVVHSFMTTPRIGIDSAGEWKSKLWRFVSQTE